MCLQGEVLKFNSGKCRPLSCRNKSSLGSERFSTQVNKNYTSNPQIGKNEDQQKELSPMTHVAKDKNIPPFLILHVADRPDSGRQSKAFAKALGYPIEFLQREDGLYLASLDNLLDVVATQDPGFNNLMLFGHNPGMTDFANYLVPGITSNLPTAGFISVNVDCDDWLLYDRPKTELVVHDYPKKRK